jgi:pyruvate/2-oxoglutarate dehydrogenase complex dihydrolipoamide acyltransferase (E2) component
MLNGQLSSIPQLTVTLSCDARVVDGDVAGHFLQALGAHMHNAAALLVQH